MGPLFLLLLNMKLEYEYEYENNLTHVNNSRIKHDRVGCLVRSIVSLLSMTNNRAVSWSRDQNTGR